MQGTIVAVWLFCVDGPNAGKMVLSKRSKEESFAGIYQSTWNGKVLNGEGVADAILRECAEELGWQFSLAFSLDIGSLLTFSVDNVIRKQEIWESINFLGFARKDQIDLIQPGKEVESVSFVDDFNLLTISRKSDGKDPNNVIVMFDDQLVVLHKIFQLKKLFMGLLRPPKI